MADEKKRKRYRGQIIRSGEHGGVLITREMVEGMLKQLRESPKPMNIEHDPTVPPVGRVKEGWLVEVESGEVALETEMELFDGTMPVVLKPTREFREEVTRLPGWPTADGVLEITIDPRSYSRADVEALRDIAAGVGEAEAGADAMRFSELPDPLLIFGLGSSLTAAGWFIKGFFTKTGEVLGEEVGKDLAEAYRQLKKQAVEMIERRNPADRSPITLLSFQIDRPGGGIVEIEGSTRAVGAELEAFLDAGSQLLPIATVFLRAAPEPGRIMKMHFAYTKEGWAFVYGLDEEARPLMIASLNDEDFARAKAEAEAAASGEGSGRESTGG
jgi:hypothetical protein